MSILGIDVSHFNGAIDWHKAAQSISFGFARATQGTGFVDPCFHPNWKLMKEAVVPRGAYHYFEPRKDAVAQAEFFLRTARMAVDDLPPMLMVETVTGSTGPAVVDGIARWMGAVQTATRKKPMLSISPGFWEHIGNPASPVDCPLWTMQYGTRTPALPPSWTHWSFWQFTQVGRCSGVEGHVNLTRFCGSLEDLRAMSVSQIPGSHRFQAKLVA